MPTITDDEMRQILPTSKAYTLMILKAGPNRYQPWAEKIIWEHVRRNFEYRAEGVLAIVCPVTDDGAVRGIGIYAATPEQTKQIMEDDPAVKAEVLTYEIHPCRGFPGDSLP
jgi:hypothetical protein